MSRCLGRELVVAMATYTSAGLLLGCAADAGPLKATVPDDSPEGSGGRKDGASGGNRTGGAPSGGGGTSSGGTTTGGASQTGGTSSGGVPGNSTGGASQTGGTSSGGTPGNSTGGASQTGGTSSGGTPGNPTGGVSTTGGRATGGAMTGGSSGASTGGKATGGAATGGSSTGGRATGGSSTGGRATGGTSTGGRATGGAATGGSSCANFSFFVTSMAAIVRVSGSSSGFGGDLRHGQADGLAGADKICAEIAATALPCASSKTWRAFLSTSSVDAIDRIGSGPWYDRNGLKVWNSLSEMTADRPPTSYVYRDDLPNEDGTPNHDYDLDGNVNDDDNHDFLTGSGSDGRKFSSDTAAGRCNDWTSTTASGKPWCGHSWPRQGSGTHWIHSIQEGGCQAGFNLAENSIPIGCSTVGCGGGYGGIYCFALTP
jgi:hypothetical protein